MPRRPARPSPPSGRRHEPLAPCGTGVQRPPGEVPGASVRRTEPPSESKGQAHGRVRGATCSVPGGRARRGASRLRTRDAAGSRRRPGVQRTAEASIAFVVSCDGSELFSHWRAGHRDGRSERPTHGSGASGVAPASTRGPTSGGLDSRQRLFHAWLAPGARPARAQRLRVLGGAGAQRGAQRRGCSAARCSATRVLSDAGTQRRGYSAARVAIHRHERRAHRFHQRVCQDER